jgi:NaMN:DMB phosphoribosyltransferase
MGEDIRFRGRVRFWDEAAGKGLAVVDVPAELVERLGGRKQYRVAGTVNGAAYAGSGMLVAGGGYCVGVSAAALKAAGAAVGDEVDVSIARA